MRYSCTLRTGAFVGRYGVGRRGVKLRFRMLKQAGTLNLNTILPLQYLFGNILGGVYGRPVYHLLAGQCALLVVHAQPIKAVPGRKTAVKDAAWIAELLRHGLLRGSFIPAKPQRQLRELTRYRSTLVQDHARALNRLQAVLEDANLKLASVMTDIYGVSARAMLEAIRAGQRDVEVLADLARGCLRAKRDQLKEALEGRVTAHHSFLLTEHLTALEYLDEAIARVSTEIAQRLTAEQEALALLDTIPGVGQRAAEILIAEIGTDMSRFPSAKHLASWAGMCPGNHESGGKRLSGKTRKGSRWLRQILVEIAHVASKTKNTYLAAQYRRIAARRGKKRALIAVGHTILTIVYTLLTRRQPSQDLDFLPFVNPNMEILYLSMSTFCPPCIRLAS
jgi:transposase